jgi:hypothetical protein
MSARVTATTQVVASAPPGQSTPWGQGFILGVTQKGPIDKAVRVTGMADYQQVFGERAGGTDTFDTVEVAFKEGLASAWVVRLAGPAAAAASKAVGTLTVTADSPGAWGNSIAVAWTNATKTLTVDGTDYLAPDLATLQSALLWGVNGVPVPVSVSGTLPTSDVASGNLSGGTDDAGNASIASNLALFSADLGDGAVTVVGKTAAQVADTLAAHCQATDRHGLIPAVSGSTLTQAVAELASLTDPSLTLLWPDPTVGDKAYNPAGAALGWRARAMGTGNPAATPIFAAHGTARFVTGVRTDITDEQWRQANAAGLSVIRTIRGQVRMAGWRSVAAPGGARNLQGANYRDLIDRVRAGAQQVADDFAGTNPDGRGINLAMYAGSLGGFLAELRDAGAFTPGDNDPGFVVDVGPGVNPPSQIAAGLIRAKVGFRAVGTAEWFEIVVVVTDPAGTL